jgi:hypothetical protein
LAEDIGLPPLLKIEMEGNDVDLLMLVVEAQLVGGIADRNCLIMMT